MVQVSIIIPTYKGKDNILVAVNSALNLIDVDKEIIVVDDNGIGTENQMATFKCLEKFINESSIIYMAHEKNMSGSAARNTGFKRSNGKYIVFLDDDDYLFPSKICKQIKQLEEAEKGYGFSVSAGYYVHKNGKGYRRGIKFADDFMYKYLLDQNYFNTSALLIRREIVEKLECFDVSFRRHQDWEFCTRMLEITKPCYINEPLFIKYAENRNSPSNLKTRCEQLDFFIEKMAGIWYRCLTVKQINKIKNYRYRQVFQSYILAKDFFGGVKYLKSKNCDIFVMIYACFEFVIFVFRRIFKGNKKITYSYEEVYSLLQIGE